MSDRLSDPAVPRVGEAWLQRRTHQRYIVARVNDSFIWFQRPSGTLRRETRIYVRQHFMKAAQQPLAL